MVELKVGLGALVSVVVEAAVSRGDDGSADAFVIVGFEVVDEVQGGVEAARMRPGAAGLAGIAPVVLVGSVSYSFLVESFEEYDFLVGARRIFEHLAVCFGHFLPVGRGSVISCELEGSGFDDFFACIYAGLIVPSGGLIGESAHESLIYGFS